MEWSKQFLDNQRLKGDDAGEKLIADTFSKGKHSTLYELLKLEGIEIKKRSNSAIKKFLISRREKPTWFNSVRLQHRQRLFERYASEMMALAGCYVVALLLCSLSGKQSFISIR